MQQNIKRSNVLKRRGDISILFKIGNLYKSKSFSIRFNRNNLELNRFAVLVSKKNGIAVERNRIKRVYREVIKEYFNIDSSFFLDVAIRPNIGKTAEYIEVKKEFLKWLQILNKK